MCATTREPRWNIGVVIVTVALCAPFSSSIARAATPPSDVEAGAFLADWLHARGYGSPTFEVSSAGVPRGADAATMCKAKTCVIRIRPESLHSRTANERLDSTARPQWENLLLHEAVHYIDILRRGSSDHGLVFRKLARELGVMYEKP